LQEHDSAAAPFSLFVSFVCPHPPYIAPAEFYDLYPEASMPVPKLSAADAPTHPWIQAMQRNRNYNDFVTDESRRVIASSYHGCISYLDYNVGRVLDALDDAGLRESTLVIFTSDHGDNLGARRLYGKSNMYQEAAHIPMIVAGPEVPEGRVSETPVTLLDIASTVLDAADMNEGRDADALPGTSLIELSQGADDDQRVAFCEYYAAAADRAAFMVRRGCYKYIHYVGYEPELFDLNADPEELDNLAVPSGFASVVKEHEAILRAIVDPEMADDVAFHAQTALVDANGGREALIARGKYDGTPAPGQAAVFDR
jgi:choline-sulfatase